MIKRALLPGAAAVLLLCACSGGGPSSVPPAVRTPADLNHNASSSKIKHVVIIVQENRTFDNFFATYPGVDGAKVVETDDS